MMAFPGPFPPFFSPNFLSTVDKLLDFFFPPNSSIFSKFWYPSPWKKLLSWQEALKDGSHQLLPSMLENQQDFTPKNPLKNFSLPFLLFSHFHLVFMGLINNIAICLPHFLGWNHAFWPSHAHPHVVVAFIPPAHIDMEMSIFLKSHFRTFSQPIEPWQVVLWPLFDW